MFFAGGIIAQNKNTARKLFQQKKYAEAKPMFQKLLKKNPKDAECSYWYAVCCCETGDSVDVLPLFEYAASRSISNAFRYLGDYYAGKCNFPQALSYYNESRLLPMRLCATSIVCAILI